MSEVSDTFTRISLQLDLMAKNLLVEEYPKAKEFITGQKGDENVWLEGDALKEYAKEYAKKYLYV